MTQKIEAAAVVPRKKPFDLSKQLQTAKLFCVEYSNNSSVHGFRYLTEEHRTLFEKIWWAIVIFISFILCGQLISELYGKWNESPVIVSFSEKATSITQIPFPAITICPESKADADRFRISDALTSFESKFIDTSVRSRLVAIAQVCTPELFKDLLQDQPTECSECLKILRQISLPKDSFFKSCSYQEFTGGACEGLFGEIITDEGVCFTFNALKMTDIFREETIIGDYRFLNHSRVGHWSMEDGYALDAPLQTFPFRALGVGVQMGISLDLAVHVRHFENSCKGKAQGFKMVLHAPSEIPQLSKYFQKLPIEHEVIVTVRPEMMTTDEDLQSYRPVIRQCFFNNERHLRYFKIYTQQNCIVECLTNFTLKQCGCVQFYMPRHAGLKICAIEEFACIEQSENDLRQQAIEKERNYVYNPSHCNCWPACTAITYDTETTQVELNLESLTQNKKEKITRLSLLFKEEQFFSSKRSELYGQTDFIANCGGLLGLFMGVSLLSIVEVFYFFTLRLCCTLRMRRAVKAEMEAIEAPPIFVVKPAVD